MKDIKKLVKDTFEKFDNISCDIYQKNKATQIGKSAYPMFLCDDCYNKQLNNQKELVENIIGGDI